MTRNYDIRGKQKFIRAIHGKMKCYIKENSFIARIAAWKLNSNQVAIVIGKTIHLHNTNKNDFLADAR